MFARLNEVGPWRWLERDNDRWADYLSAVFNRAAPCAIVKIIYDEGLYAVNVNFSSDDPDAEAEFEAMRHTLFELLLPAIGARDLAETDDYE